MILPRSIARLKQNIRRNCYCVDEENKERRWGRRGETTLGGTHTDENHSINSILKSKQFICTVCLQMNGAGSKVNKKFISQLTRAQRTPPAAATVQVSQPLPTVRFSCLLRGRGVSLQDGAAAGKAFGVLRFEVSRSVITVQREFRAL